MAHFRDLEIVIRRVDAASVCPTKTRSVTADVHLATSHEAGRTACGEPVEGLSAVFYNVELFRACARPCRACLHATGS